jgi:CBS domain-containing membrane protein
MSSAMKLPPTAAARVATPTSRLLAWLNAFRPPRTAVSALERWRVALGAALGIALVVLLCRPWGDVRPDWPWIVAPMGASAVLVFAVPGSPFAHPWSVIGGNVVSALVGVLCVRWLGAPAWSAAPSVGLAILAMLALRCLHPPGGATALTVAVLGVTDPLFAWTPVAVNAGVLAVAGLAYNNLTRHSYPHRPLPQAPASIDADLDAVLARHDRVLDIGRDELRALLEDIHLQGYQRKLAELRCGDIMSRRLITVGRTTPVAEAWSLFRQHRIKALPVVDAAGSLVGIVTPADFTRDEQRVTSGSIGSLMTRQVRVARAGQHLADLIPLFGSTGHHHIPVVEDGRLVGILTQSDVVAALYRPTQPGTDRDAMASPPVPQRRP